MDSIIPQSQQIITKEGITTFEKVIGDDCKLLGLYFSMHDCPPCREFTPIFAELYNEVNENVKVMEVIFFSGDKT